MKKLSLIVLATAVTQNAFGYNCQDNAGAILSKINGAIATCGDRITIVNTRISDLTAYKAKLDAYYNRVCVENKGGYDECQPIDIHKQAIATALATYNTNKTNWTDNKTVLSALCSTTAYTIDGKPGLSHLGLVNWISPVMPWIEGNKFCGSPAELPTFNTKYTGALPPLINSNSGGNNAGSGTINTSPIATLPIGSANVIPRVVADPPSPQCAIITSQLATKKAAYILLAQATNCKRWLWREANTPADKDKYKNEFGAAKDKERDAKDVINGLLSDYAQLKNCNPQKLQRNEYLPKVHDNGVCLKPMVGGFDNAVSAGKPMQNVNLGNSAEGVSNGAVKPSFNNSNAQPNKEFANPVLKKAGYR
jgi:hypothetical protein